MVAPRVGEEEAFATISDNGTAVGLVEMKDQEAVARVVEGADVADVAGADAEATGLDEVTPLGFAEAVEPEAAATPLA